MKRKLFFGAIVALCSLGANAQNEWKNVTPAYLKPTDVLSGTELTTWRSTANLSNTTDNLTGPWTLTGGQIGSHYSNMVSSFSPIVGGFQIAGFNTDADNKATNTIAGWVAYYMCPSVDVIPAGKDYRISYNYDVKYFANAPASATDIVTLDVVLNGVVVTNSLVNVNSGVTINPTAGIQTVTGSYTCLGNRNVAYPLKIRVNMPNSGVVNKSVIRLTDIFLDIKSPVAAADITALQSDLARAKSTIESKNRDNYPEGSSALAAYDDLNNYLTTLQSLKDTNNVALFSDYNTGAVSPTFLFERGELIAITHSLTTKADGLITTLVLNPNQTQFKAWSEESTIKVAGSDQYEIYSATGSKLPHRERFNPGVYIVKSGANRQKIIVK